MLAWARLVYNLAEDEEVTLVVCDDPWLFRHLAKINGVNATKPPMLVKQVLCLVMPITIEALTQVQFLD